MKIARIAIDVPLHQLFDYCGDGVDSGDIGCLALVPFGGHNTLGVIVELAGTSDVPAARLKKIIRVLRDAPALRGDDLDLMRFAAAYYHYALGATIVGTLPARLRRRETRNVEPLAFALTAEGAAVAMEDLPQRAAVQRRLLAYMRERQQVDEMAIRRLAPSARAALKTFAAKGWVTRVQSIPPARSTSDRSVPPPYELTNEQAAAAAAIRSELDRFAPFVLFGVTGSGKTEVYLYAMEAVLRSGRQILYLVPEIGLTPQLETAIRQRFPATSFVALHSGLNETERFTHWRAAHAGEARIVLGTRLAVFAPMPQLGLIIVDEEHDASFKQFDALRYSARDLAVVRARQRGIPIVLGSATPALETYHNAVSGRYRLLMLRQRINATPPHIECVNTRGERLSEAGLSARLLAKVEACLERKEQILVFLNRRGFAPVVMCQACSWLSRCHRCSANLVLHRAEHQLRCHHCGHTARIPAACPNCGSQELHPVGHGTQRIEAALRGHFPRARILRIDRDSTRRKTAWPAMRQEIVTREVDILIGTQILAKGHDFPHLSLVGVLNADSLLYSADIRAS